MVIDFNISIALAACVTFRTIKTFVLSIVDDLSIVLAPHGDPNPGELTVKQKPQSLRYHSRRCGGPSLSFLLGRRHFGEGSAP